ncbi:MAG: sigma-70 family RNA polymerase sigma factor [Alphaproteobacteria bacterium]|nr:sigma-70 family RNA polymerase sigma factor [Alphaproteobacteria bacterium]MCB9694605.1 sigma-70 family RNA polymerase sigma factor [Alphaproteobacteria bacterium]
MPTDPTSRALARLADGDRSAFDTVYREAWPRVRALTSRLLAGDPEAEDVAQQALLTAFARATDYDPSRPALPWILGIAAGSVRTHRRRQTRRREVALPTALVEPGTPEDAVVRADLERAITEVLGTLSPLDRETLLLGVGDRPADATFRKRLQRALGRLRQSFRSTHGSL